MANLSFIKQYVTKPRTTGAILPSSKYLATKMVSGVNFDAAKCIVEYGPGTGVFTEKILEKRKADTLIILLEFNEEFCNMLRKKYKEHKNEQNLHIINDSAENIGKHLQAYGVAQADYIISGLPFASLPPEISANILTATQKYLAPGGQFITFQYTLFKKKLFQKYFGKIESKREWRNVPPAHALFMSNRQD